MAIGLALLVLSLMSATTTVRSDFASDQAECESQLIGMATCITYVQGSAKAPTPDCCSGIKAVVAKSFKCVCVLIKDRDEPGLGFKINVSRALLLPSKCETPANVADCPRLLNLPANSTEAKVFEQFGKAIANNGAGASGVEGSGSSTGSSSSSGSAGGQSSKNSSNTSGVGTKRWLGASASAGVWALLFILHVIFN